jgi:DNA-directed RNA polymerase specialized sigma24 family protein
MAAVELDDGQLERIMELGHGDLRAALGSLPADQREAVLRRVVLDESYRAIAGLTSPRRRWAWVRSRPTE